MSKPFPAVILYAFIPLLAAGQVQAKPPELNTLEIQFLKDLQGEWDNHAQNHGRYLIIVNDEWFQFKKGAGKWEDRGTILVKKTEKGTVFGYVRRQNSEWENWLYSAGPTICGMTYRRTNEAFDNDGTALLRARTISELENNRRLPVVQLPLFKAHENAGSAENVPKITKQDALDWAKTRLRTDDQGLFDSRPPGRANEGHWFKLEQLTPDVAEIIARCAPRLHLNSLKSLNVVVAAILTRHTDELTLNGLKEIDKDVARVLASHAGNLSIAGLEEINEAVPQELIQFQGKQLRLPKTSDEAVTKLLEKNPKIALPDIINF